MRSGSAVGLGIFSMIWSHKAPTSVSSRSATQQHQLSCCNALAIHPLQRPRKSSSDSILVDLERSPNRSLANWDASDGVAVLIWIVATMRDKLKQKKSRGQRPGWKTANFLRKPASSRRPPNNFVDNCCNSLVA